MVEIFAFGPCLPVGAWSCSVQALLCRREVLGSRLRINRELRKASVFCIFKETGLFFLDFYRVVLELQKNVAESTANSCAVPCCSSVLQCLPLALTPKFPVTNLILLFEMVSLY